MASKTVLTRLVSSQRAAISKIAVASSRRALFTLPAQKYYHSSPPWQQDVSSQQSQRRAGKPIAESMKSSATPTGNNATAAVEINENRNAAFLGEADSDDGFEADVEINPEAHRHRFEDVAASGLHGQSGEGDEPIELPRRPQESLDGSNSAYLGEADSNDAHEADREASPDKYRHNISDLSHAAFLGEADSDDAHEADREANPEAYRHKIEDVGASGLHGGPGEGDENIPRGGKGKSFI